MVAVCVFVRMRALCVVCESKALCIVHCIHLKKIRVQCFEGEVVNLCVSSSVSQPYAMLVVSGTLTSLRSVHARRYVMQSHV
jgi:hypothetical protein